MRSGEIIAGLVSSTTAIPLAMAFGMFAFVPLGDEYFAYGAMAGLLSAVISGVISVVFGDRSTRVYAPRITTTFFLGLLLFSLLHRDPSGHPGDVSATLLVFFAIVLIGGLIQALGELDGARPLCVIVALLTFMAMWHARRITTKVPPLLVGLGVGIVAYYALTAIGLGDHLGPVIGPLTASAAMRAVLVDFSGLAMGETLENFAYVILTGALALAIIASIDALLCAKLTCIPGELRSADDRLLVRLGLANAVSAGFGGITSGINIGPSLVNRAFGGRSFVSVLVNAAVLLVAATVLFPVLAYMPRAVLSATIMVVAIQHIEPWTRQLATRLFSSGTPQRGVIALDLAVSLFVSVLSITINVVAAVFIGIATFVAGAVFGELALLDRGPRSATVTADEDIEGFGLSETPFAELCRQYPDIAIKLLQALGRELSVRIRHANMTIQQLET